MSKFNHGKWIKSYKALMLKKDEKVTLKDLLHTTKVDDKKADKVDIKLGAENDLAIEKDKDGHDVYARGLTEAAEYRFQAGDMYSNDFDYVGMLTAGSEAVYEMGLENLQKLYDSFEDVNYHSENKFLGYAIEDMEDMRGIEDEEKVKDSLEDFRNACLATLKDITRR